MILVAVRDLLFASKIQAAAERLGVTLSWAPREAPLAEAAVERRPTAVLADLGLPGAMEALRAVRAALPAARLVGYLGHLRTDLADEARALGVDEVLTRGQLAASLDAVLLAAAEPSTAAGGAPSASHEVR